MFNRTCRTLLSVSACLVVGSTGAWAGTLTGVIAPGDLGATASIDWGQLGPEFTTVPTPSLWTATDGTIGLVGQVGGADTLRMDQSSGWAGNFTPGDHLIWNQGSGQNIGLEPFSLLWGFGANIQADFYGDFTATVTAYDDLGNALGSFSEAGTSNGNSDGTAIFIGLKDTDAEIAFATFSVVDISGGNDFAINTALISTPVPEPGSVAMLVGLGFSGGGLLIRKRRK